MLEDWRFFREIDRISLWIVRVQVSDHHYDVVSIRTSRRFELVDITHQVADVVVRSGVSAGIAVIYSPHTTGGITINEGADPDVRRDITRFLGDLVPQDWGFKHMEGNSDAHIKTSLMGASESVIVEGGALVLGTWQRVYFCEFDGPRTRRFFVKTLSG